MSMTFEEMKARMCAAGSMEVGKGASEAEIAVAEKTLGVPIQGDYRRFLLEFGWGGAESLELFGLGADVPRHLDLVEITLSERTEMHPRLPHHLLPLMNNGAGDHYCLDTTTTSPMVVGWWHEEDESQEPTMEGADFSTWFAEHLRDLESPPPARPEGPP